MATHQAASNTASTNDSSLMLADPSLSVGTISDNSAALTQGTDSTASTHTPAPSHFIAPSDPLHTMQYISDNA